MQLISSMKENAQITLLWNKNSLNDFNGKIRPMMWTRIAIPIQIKDFKVRGVYKLRSQLTSNFDELDKKTYKKFLQTYRWDAKMARELNGGLLPLNHILGGFV